MKDEEDIYDGEAREEEVDDAEISPAEAGFVRGYEEDEDTKFDKDRDEEKEEE